MTAVEWLIDELSKFEKGESEYFSTTIIKNKAIRMEKQQIIDAQMDMFNHINKDKFGLDYLNKRDAAEEFAEQYYNETYGNKTADT